MGSGLQYVGKSISVLDGPEKVSGKIKYVGDIKLEGMLYCRLLLSPIAHGKVKKIVLDEAEKVPGVFAIFTYMNTPNKKYNRYLWYVGQEGRKNERLLTDYVRHYGDRIAAVLATDKEAAETAVQLIKVEYERLPASIDSEAALADHSCAVSGFENPIEEVEFGYGNVEEVFDQADLIIDDKVTTQIFHHATIEPHGYIADCDARGNITVWSPCHSVYGVRKAVAEFLGTTFNKVRVIKIPMGGSFGAKQDIFLEPLVAYLAAQTKRPVQLLLDRREAMIASCTGASTVGYIKTAVTANGEIQAQSVKVILNAGGYASNSMALVKALGKNTSRLYRIGSLDFKGYPVHTNAPVCGAARGYGSPQLHILREIHMDHIADQLGMDPLELRLKNVVQPGDIDPLINKSLGNARVLDCLNRGAQLFDWKAKRLKAKKGDGRIRKGVGLACASYINGYYGTMFDFATMTLKMHEDGSATLNATLHDLGCGTITSITQIVAEVLELEPDKIKVTEADTERSPYDVGTRASRAIFVSGSCAKLVAEDVKSQLIREAADFLGAEQSQLVCRNGQIAVKGATEKRISFKELVTLVQNEKNTEIIATRTFQSQANPGSYGAHFAEVEVDTETGLVSVTDYLAVHDVGYAINPGMVEGQLQGAVQMGIGLALYEQLQLDETGVVRNCSLSKYHLINSPDMPSVKVELIEEGEDSGPYGAKSIGEIAVIPSAPAVVNAVNHALDTRLIDLPLTPEKIVQAIAEKGQLG